MGRIDQALRLSNVDAVNGTGAAAAPADASPWALEAPVGHEAEAPTTAGDSAAQARGGDEAPPENHRVTSRVRVAARAVQRLVVAKEAPPLLVEQFRGLAATLHGAQREQ